MFGKGLLTGMLITLKRFFGRPNTVQYPDERLPMTARFRGGALTLDINRCIACGLCAMACPNQAIGLATTVDESKKKSLTSYIHHTGLCLYCNLCLEACPAKALTWDQNYEAACYLRQNLDVDCLAVARRRLALPAAAEPALAEGRIVSG